jgi:hypothetical protein
MSGPGTPHHPPTLPEHLGRGPAGARARGTVCYGTRWWTKRGTPDGCCCGMCHPPEPEQVRWAPEPRGCCRRRQTWARMIGWQTGQGG